MGKSVINLGDKVKDKVTGYTGIVMSITQYLTGCDHAGLQSQSKKNKEGAPPEWVWFDVTRLTVVTKGAVKLGSKKDDPGGPAPSAPSR